MKDTRTAVGLLRRCWSRLLDGQRRWGSVDIRPDRYGVTRYRLVVYPPGISTSERRRVRIWRGSPLWGALLWIVAEIILSQAMGPWPALAISSTLYVVSGAVALALVGDARTQVRTMAVLTMPGYGDAKAVATRNMLKMLAAELLQADSQLDEGVITPVEHEAVWWRVYDQVGCSVTPYRSGRRI